MDEAIVAVRQKSTIDVLANSLIGNGGWLTLRNDRIGRSAGLRRVLNGTFESYTKLGQASADSGTSMRSRLTASSVYKAHIRTNVLLGYKNRSDNSEGIKIKYVIDPKYSHMVHLETRLLGNGTERARPTLGTNLSYFSVSQIFLEGQENVGEF